MRIIEKLEPSKHVRGRFLVWIEGERDPVKVTENEVLSFALYQGRELEEEQWQELVKAGAASSARTLGAKLLAERPRSRRELLRSLREKGEAPEAAEAAADWLEELGVLNDLEYARGIVRHYEGRGYGVQRLRQEFQKRGIPRELWDEALEEQTDPVDRVVDFLERRLRGEDPDPKTMKRTTDALLRRGFRWEEIKAGLSRYGTVLEEESL